MIMFIQPAYADIAPDPISSLALPTEAIDWVPWMIVLLVLCNYGFTLLFELPILYAFKFRTGKALLVAFIANLLSVTLLHLTTIVFDWNLVLMELIVIMLEFVVIKLWLGKAMSWGRVLLAVFIANLVSSVIGSFIVLWIVKELLPLL